MSDGSGEHFAHLPKTKRSRRKKHQKNYQDMHKDQMIQQLGRRFHNKPSTSSCSPTNVGEIPLPPEAPNTFGAPPPLTEEDYQVNYMEDPEVVSSHSAELIRSYREVVKADEAELYMLNRSRTTTVSVLSEFRTRVLNNVKSKRNLQTIVPNIDYPLHSMTSRKARMRGDGSDMSSSDETGSESDSESEETESGSDSKPGPSTANLTKSEKRDERKKESQKKKSEEKERQMTLLRMGVERKRNHPNGVDPDISFNEKGLGNDGPECRCPPVIKNRGLKHGYYAGENKVLNCTRTCGSNLHYYTLQVKPGPNEGQIYKTGMTINGETYEFEGFSMITHAPLPECMTRRPICKYSLEYEFQLVEERFPIECFDPEDCNHLFDYIFHEIFEMFDFNLHPKHLPPGIVSCPMIHIMPRFVAIKNGVAHLWSTKTLLAYFLINGDKELFNSQEIIDHCEIPDDAFSRVSNKMKQSILLNALKKPSALRADWFERDSERREVYIVHNSIRSQNYSTPILVKIAQLEKRLNRMKKDRKFAGKNKEYDVVKRELDQLKDEHRNARYLSIRKSVAGYIDTGFKPDIIAHIAMVIIASHHIRYNFSLSVFEEIIEYQFNDRKVIELALIHSSFRSHYGTPPDHIKNIISNCGYRRKYGSEEKREKKKGIVSLFNIMGGETEGGEPILHNERLEYLGDAVVELIVSHHLYFMLPHHFEGGLATYRTALVQNRNLADLAKNCRIDEMLQYAHGADLINEAEWKHALANAFEAVVAAVYLDGGLGACDRLFSKAMYGSAPNLKKVWDHINEHELKREDPLGDRELSNITPALASFHKLENILNIKFNNIRLLAKAFTRRNVPHNDLTKGHNQRLEWLGDSVLQLVVSDYLFRRYPLHHEGHMSLLRTSLVSNQTQSVVCDDLGFLEFVVKPPHKTPELKMKDKADLVEAFIGALYVDRGIEHCRSFIRIVFCPRLKHFINSEQWNDAKSHLQQWCLAIRDAQNPNPAMPDYRILSIEGPTNNRIFKVGVYFRGKRLASAAESNVHKAELKAAEIALASLESTSVSRMKEKNMGDKDHHRRHRIISDD
ncbi:hypothetical protein GCK72_000627 [Caenorhabditis remanei]|uniref:Uncharacterized protein n=1 Tax=Caenorhabditis remanei TaxID=31234 RepID=A0A6A5HQD2_CAERE|nr:hypothetical protein GCK72_000627 [Caenorhabditis remanei]KAF1768814.1 hypothetical protein GCK72_000627 [Caenorhabditis remanei]